MNTSPLHVLIALLVALVATPLHADEGGPEANEPEANEPAAVEVAAPAAPPPPLVGFEKGFFIASPDDAFRLVLGARAQVRFEFENEDGTPRTNSAAFLLPRVRIKLKGHLFDKRIKYALQVDFAKGGVGLKDAFLDLVANEWLILRMGQFKTPHSRQLLTSSTKQQLVDRAITGKAFALDRDIGLMLMNDWKKSPLEYAVGIFNGTGEKGQWSGSVVVDPATGEGDLTSAKASNVPDLPDPLVVVRVGVHSPGFDGYSEGDPGHSDFGVGVGGGVYFDFDADDDDDAGVGGNIDFALRVKGLSTTAAFYLAAEQDGAGIGDQTLDSVGGHVSVGYAIAGRVEPVVRFAGISAIDGSGDTLELLGGVNVFIFEHNVKWVTDAGPIVNASSTGSTADVRVRTQFQLDF